MGGGGGPRSKLPTPAAAAVGAVAAAISPATVPTVATHTLLLLLSWPPVLVVLPPLLLWPLLVLHVRPPSANARAHHSLCSPLHSSAPTPALAFVVTLVRACSYPCLCSSMLVWAPFTVVHAHSPSFMPTRLCSVSWSPLPGHACLAFICTHSGSFGLCSDSFSLYFGK
jgi:hypothetical protein